MKNLILTLAVITGFAACKNNTDTTQTREIQLLTDTTSYHNNNIYSDTVATVKSEVAATEIREAPKAVTQVIKVIRVYSNEGAKAPVKTSKATVATVPPVVVTPPVVAAPAPAPAPTTSTGSNTNIGLPGTGENSTASTPQPEKKKGWNKATKGAVIGGVAGAVGGAVIGKKKGLGAVIGGVVGAAGGYIIGKDMEKRDANKFNF